MEVKPIASRHTLNGTALPTTSLTRREREILDIIYRFGKATVQDVRDELPDRLHYSTVRALLRVLEGKGHVYHTAESLRYMYRPVVRREEAAENALQHVIATFFDGSARRVLDVLFNGMSPEELRQARELIEFKRKQT